MIEDNLIEAKNGVIITLQLVPNQKKFKLIEFNEWNNALRLSTKKKAIEGKANQEIEKELSMLLNAKTTIIKGKKSKTKKVLIQDSKKNVLKKLVAVLQKKIEHSDSIKKINEKR